jgi:hypothetical protein
LPRFRPVPHERNCSMESFRQALGAIYVALADAAGGDEVLRNANTILTNAVDEGAVNDPYARTMLKWLVRDTTD